jgi:primosomal protein N' (replication factor Y)
LLHQDSGRAGREDKLGRAFIQTYLPDHALMKALASGSREQFLEIETAQRHAAQMPPFSRLVGVIVSAQKESVVLATVREMAAIAPHASGIDILGPVPAPMARLRGRIRYRFLVRADKTVHVQKLVRDWINRVKISGTLKIHIDVDPQSFM